MEEIGILLVCIMITLTKLQFDCLTHEVMQCECHLQYATELLMLCVVCWISLFLTSIFTQITAKEPSLESMCNINLICYSPACVASVERERGRGNLGAGESVWGAQGRKERNPSSLLPRAWCRTLIPFPFPFERLPHRPVTLWGLKHFVRNKKLNNFCK